MSDVVASFASVVPFQRRDVNKRAEVQALLDTVSSAGAIEIAPRAFAARDAAQALHLMGFVEIAELRSEGPGRPLRASDMPNAAPFLAWRVSRAPGR
jgi:hypothetical protein